MKCELRTLETPKMPATARKRTVTTLKNLPTIDICCIGGIGFDRNIRRPRSVMFTTTLAEIDYLIKEKHKQQFNPLGRKNPELTDEQLVDQKLPTRYYEFKDVFSRAASDALPPHRLYNHKIELLEGSKESELGYSPLRQQSLEELQATKKYIVEHLDKGFIEPS